MRLALSTAAPPGRRRAAALPCSAMAACTRSASRSCKLRAHTLLLPLSCLHQRVVLHPQYNRASELNDVAILVLALPVTTKPVALPPAPGTPAARQSLAIRKSEMLYVAGWGATKVADWSPALR